MTIIEQTETESVRHENVAAVDFLDGYVVVMKEGEETYTMDVDSIVSIVK